MSHYTILKSKLHRATVTGASLHYEGSLTIAEDLAEKAGFLRYETHPRGKHQQRRAVRDLRDFWPRGIAKVIELNGATAHLGKSATGSRS